MDQMFIVKISNLPQDHITNAKYAFYDFFKSNKLR
jgi:hypothetical protein